MHLLQHLFDLIADVQTVLVDKFCYLADMLSVKGDADAAVKVTIQVGLNKFKHMVPLLTTKDISLIR